MHPLNTFWKLYMRQQYARIDRFIRYPEEVQLHQFKKLIHRVKDTEWGRKYDYASIHTPEQLRERVPVQRYEMLKPYIERMMRGEEDILWPGKVRNYTKTSGTSSGRSKYLPLSTYAHLNSDIRGGTYTIALMHHLRPDIQFFGGKNFLMSGSMAKMDEYPGIRVGDLTAHSIQRIPWPFSTTNAISREISLMQDFETKLELMAQAMVGQDIRLVSGFPSWVTLLFKRILEITGKDNILEVWKNFRVYIHGGVSILPYRSQLRHFLPSDDVLYLESYSASEGYFAATSETNSDDMLLFLDTGCYYEFLPEEEWDKEYPHAIPLSAVETGRNYALLLSNASGLWRYQIGDSIMFTSTSPYKVKVSGRTQHYMDAFGEKVMVVNADRALEMTCRETNAVLQEYTASPLFFPTTESSKGCHEWVLEFDQEPRDLQEFAVRLDENLKQLNEDYEGQRTKDVVLALPRIHTVPHGTFIRWLKARGRIDAQQKVPRLSNSRDYVEGILRIAASGQ